MRFFHFSVYYFPNFGRADIFDSTYSINMPWAIIHPILKPINQVQINIFCKNAFFLCDLAGFSVYYFSKSGRADIFDCRYSINMPGAIIHPVLNPINQVQINIFCKKCIFSCDFSIFQYIFFLKFVRADNFDCRYSISMLGAIIHPVFNPINQVKINIFCKNAFFQAIFTFFSILFFKVWESGQF